MKKAILLLGLILVFVLTACGKEENGGETQNGTIESSETGSNTVSMEALRSGVVEVLGENYWPDTMMDAEMFETMYGVTADMYEEFMAETPMISTNVDTLIIVKAKEDQVEAVETALNAYRENLVNDTMQYPMNMPKIQASRIETFGNYVCFVQLGADVYGEEEGEAAIAQCQEENEKALEAIRMALAE